jgi:hypothetical protein
MRAILVQLILLSIVTVIEPQARITNKIVFLVDVSGSMGGERSLRAIEQVIEVAGQETDDIEIACITFSDETNRWPEDGSWRHLPDSDALVEIRTWLGDKYQGKGTPVTPAITRALTEDKKELTVVIISDGIFDEMQDTILAHFERLQMHREEFGYGRVVLAGVGISPPEHGDELKALVEHAGIFGAGYFLNEVPPAEPDGPY